MIRVLLIEDHVIVRQGMQSLLSGAQGIRVVAEATTGKEGLALAKEKNPDVVVLDFKLPDSNGLEIARKLLRHSPDLKILIVTAMHNDMLPERLFRLGISGYLSKDNNWKQLEHAIRLTHSGQRYLSPDIANRIALSKVNPQQKNPFDALTEREMEVLLLLGKGLDTQTIAEHLFISAKTVNSYRYRIFEKLQVNNNVELLTLAIRYGIIEIDTL